MNDQENWEWLRGSLGSIQSDVAVIKSQLITIQNAQADHEQRIRQLEADVSNNKLVLRAVSTIAVIVGSAALGVMGSLVKSALGA